jgi:Calcineurin-like phosphoesterase
VHTVLDQASGWWLTKPDSAQVSWAGDQVTIENRDITWTNMLAWPSLRCTGEAVIDLIENPYLFVDVDICEDANTSAWNIYFTNDNGTTAELAPAFGYTTGTEVPLSVRAKLPVRTALADLIDGDTLRLTAVSLFAVTEIYTTVTFKKIYFAADDTALSSGYRPPAPRPRGEMPLTVPQPAPAADQVRARAVLSRPAPWDPPHTRPLLPVTATANTDAGPVALTAEQCAALASPHGQVETIDRRERPYHEFQVRTGQWRGEVRLTYSGSTSPGERLRLSVRNPANGRYDHLATDTTTLQTSVSVDAGRYARDGLLTVRAELLLVGNGSDTFLWSTDMQYYTYFEDLSPMYGQVMEYAVDSYRAGRVAYLVNTGDIVEDYRLPATWPIADKAFHLLDEAGVPYGLVAGNHDVGNHSIAGGTASCGDYREYARYFGEWRYGANDWYGGGRDDNTSHYDLITLGDYDFVFLYLGMGREAGDETVQWANDVLSRYPDRTAVVALHQYLNYDGAPYVDQFGEYVEVGRPVYERIVVPNPTVSMVLCGHVEGAVTQTKRMGERRVLEMLANYQSVNLSRRQRLTNNFFTSNGDGFVRLMTVGPKTLKFTTYSPVLDRYNAFSPAVDTGEVPIDLIPPRRRLVTAWFSATALRQPLRTAVPTAPARDGSA